ncbi:hypothetical protein Poli38472_007131 [Pythium oligandrum]|uniref:C-factor n=1 Tax=Pythium oligandrum TaxID=41045 RepID=A0A8K1C9X9_PYTOL|nr:hypothetical protein Poli38472_007130 [Pythium oligandrum]TMW58986.1 hypothetical protein Poli38472_007131 [Pythium oligandrum]|eukprot:TMW58985.1 hypothetical protein Poli38472_007130 [Pythium oligandrum]
MAGNTNTNTVIITGSNRGIGLALAAEYHAAGWNVIAAARNPSTATELHALNVYKTIQLDVADEASILRAAQDLSGEAIDLVINNAGILHNNTFLTETKAHLAHTYEVNVIGPFLVSRAFLPHLKAAVANKGSAKLIQISSTVGSIALNNGGWGTPNYRASKSALNQLNMLITHEIKNDNIATAVLCPGYVDTTLNGNTGVLKTSESAAAVVKVIAKVTLAETGKFFSHEGKELPW